MPPAPHAALCLQAPRRRPLFAGALFATSAVMRASTWLAGLAVLLAPFARMAEAAGATARLQSQTTAAYDAYVAEAEAAFLARVRSGDATAQAAPGSRVGAAADGRIIRVPGGLVHHWRGAIHVPDVRLERVIATAQRYDDYARIYAPVAESRLLRRDGDKFCVRTRVRGSVGRVGVVLDVRSVVRFNRQATTAYSVGASEDIREVVAAGQPHERLLPAGRDSGYLWRANTFTRFIQRADGVDVELETIGLSRRFPRMLGWLIEPIARRLGRQSVERTLNEFGAAIRDDSLAEPVQTGAQIGVGARRYEHHATYDGGRAHPRGATHARAAARGVFIWRQEGPMVFSEQSIWAMVHGIGLSGLQWTPHRGPARGR